jgi:hypothetical protein
MHKDKEEEEGSFMELRPESDVARLLEKLRGVKLDTVQLRNTMATNVNEVIRLVHENRSNIEDVAKDRLNLMSESMQQFLRGYREGRQTEKDKVLRADHALNEFVEYFERTGPQTTEDGNANKENDNRKS